MAKKRKRKRSPEYNRRKALRKHYQMSVADYDWMLNRQNGRCAICRKEPNEIRRLAVDHCHENHRVRGLLCTRCNTGLGKFLDDTLLLEAAIDYVERGGW